MATISAPNTPEMRYVRAYGAVVDALAQAYALFDVLTQDGFSAAVRDNARARSLQALMELKLAKDQHDAFMSGMTYIDPPSPAQMQRTITIAEALAKITASEKRFTAILNLFTEAVTAITMIHNPGAGAPAVAATAAAPGPAPKAGGRTGAAAPAATGG
jgi:hypothetical protein